jgi:hypothetical protein
VMIIGIGLRSGLFVFFPFLLAISHSIPSYPIATRQAI